MGGLKMLCRRASCALRLVVLALFAQAANGATVSDLVNQVSQQQYSQFLNNTLYTHAGADKATTPLGAQHDPCRDAILNYLRSLGLQASLDPHGAAWYGPACANVVATKAGKVRPGDVYILGAHYDSVNNPGADDNASGVAAVLETARILSQYDFEATIIFIAFDAEEYQPGYYERVGSRGYASDHQSDHILGMLALDMIAWNDGSNKAYIGCPDTNPIRNQMASAVSLYGQGLTPVLTSQIVDTDNWSFVSYGKPNCYLTEEWTNPNYHQPSDSVDTAGNIDYAYATRMTRSIVGWLATQAVLIGGSGPGPGPGPDSVAPAAVTDLAGTPGSTNGSVTLTWTAPADYDASGNGPFAVASYDLRYSTGPITGEVSFVNAIAVTGLPTPKAPGAAESFTVTGLVGGTTYYFAIKSKDSSSNVSTLSNVATAAAAVVTQSDTTPPSAVSDLAGKPSQISGGVDLTWTAPADYGAGGSGPFPVASYDLRYSTSPITGEVTFGNATIVTGLAIPKAPGAAESFTVTGLVGGTTYYFAIKSKDSSSNVSTLSNVATAAAAVVTQSDTTPPNAVSDLAGKPSQASGGVDLTWTAPADYGAGGSGPFPVTSYDLRYSTSPITGEVTFVNATIVKGLGTPKSPGAAESFTVTGLTGGTTYYFVMESKDASGNFSARSNMVTVTAATAQSDTTSPNAVSNLAGTPSQTGGGVDLTWTAPADYGAGGSGPFAVASYDLRYSTSALSEVNWAAASRVTGLPTPKTPGSPESFTVTGLTIGTTYYFAMKSTDTAGNASAISNVVAVQASSVIQKVLQVGQGGYTGVADSYMIGNSTTKNGTKTQMIVTGYADQGVSSIRRGLVRFDLSSIPPGATITAATLSLYSYSSANTSGNSGYYGLYPLSRSWTDTQANWTVATTGVTWSSPGGDFAAAPDATAAKQSVAKVWYSWDVTARVQAWLASPSTNYGWIVKCTDENLHNQDYFYQSETSSTTLRPKLVINYR